MNENEKDTSTGYDVIGDIHGYVDPLKRLLEGLGYCGAGEGHRHPEGRRVLFLGDFIDRGPAIRETLHLVRSMVDGGSAMAVMGNHEFNAVCYHTPDGKGGHLRSHTNGGGKNAKQHRETLDAFAGRNDEWEDWIEWFKGLPFSLDLGGLRAVHATWDQKMIDFLTGKSLRDPKFLQASATPGTREFVAVETALKGIEIPLPQGNLFTDKQGFMRPDIRVRWWEKPEGKSYREVVFPDCDSVSSAPVPLDGMVGWDGYEPGLPPVFFGHYWLPPQTPLQAVAPNAACLDYSIAKPGGKLVSYRWDGEQQLLCSKFVTQRN